MESILYVPGWFFSRAVCEKMPGPRRSLADLRHDFAVEIFAWPCTVGGPKKPPTWEGAVEALREAITPGSHLVVSGGDAAIALVALGSTDTEIRSLVVTGLRPPPATLRALGMAGVADATSALYRVDRVYQFVRLLMDGAPEVTMTQWAETLDADIDWPFAVQFRASYEQLNLLQEKVRAEVPVLYLDPAVRIAGYAEMREVFLRWAPDATMQDLDLWPGQLHDAESGRDFAGKVKAFIDAV